jgi:hypothetical protein
MLRGQLSTAFIMNMAIGFLLMITLVYTTLSLEDSMKRQNQEQTMAPVGEYVAVNMLSTIGQLGMGRSINQTFRIPQSGDATTGEYTVGLENISGMWYVAVRSAKWPQSAAFQPMFLDGSYVIADSKKQYPPYFCFNVTRNTTNYRIYFNC